MLHGRLSVLCARCASGRLTRRCGYHMPRVCLPSAAGFPILGFQAHASTVPGEEHVIAVLVANAPLGDPVGTIFFRYATLAFEAPAG